MFSFKLTNPQKNHWSSDQEDSPMMNKYYVISLALLLLIVVSCNANNKQVKTEVPDVNEVHYEEKGNDNDSKHEIELMTIKEKYEYNKSTYYIRLDTLKSRINVYEDFYGDFSLHYCFYIRPDTSIKYKPYIEDERTLIVRNGLIQEKRFSEHPMKMIYKYDNDKHLISIVSSSDHDKNESVDGRTEMLFKWKHDRLIEVINYSIEHNFWTSCKIVPNSSDDKGCHNEEIMEYIGVYADYYDFLNIFLQEAGLCGVVPVGKSVAITRTYRDAREAPTVYNINSTFDNMGQLSETFKDERDSCHYYRNKENMKKIFNWAKNAEKQAIVFPKPDFKGLDVKS